MEDGKTLEQAVEDLEREGILSGPQAEILRRICGRRLVSIHWELRALLYAGILTLTTGLGLLVHKSFQELSQLALLLAIGAGCAACFAYGFARGGGFDRGQVQSPDAAYDYLLLLGCLLFGTEVGYLELGYGLLGGQWSPWLLGSGLFYLLCAHYFDNRLVLSLALSTLGAWLGVRTSLMGGGDLSSWVRWNGIVFGAAVTALGALQAALRWKRHFLQVHLHLGLNILFLGLVAGVGRNRDGLLFLIALAAAAWGSALYARRAHRFAFLLYGVVYPYVGVTRFVLERGNLSEAGLAMYFLVTASGVVAALISFRRRFGSGE